MGTPPTIKLKMVKFHSHLDIRKVGARQWILLADFVFESDKYPGKFVAPKWMPTNFASIPRILWVLYPPVDIYDAAAVIHDGACNKLLLTEDGQRINTVRFVANDLFHEALLVCGVNERRAWVMYNAVRLFGQ